MDILEREAMIRTAENLGIKDAASLGDVELRDQIEAAQREKAREEVVESTSADLGEFDRPENSTTLNQGQPVAVPAPEPTENSDRVFTTEENVPVPKESSTEERIQDTTTSTTPE